MGWTSFLAAGDICIMPEKWKVGHGFSPFDNRGISRILNLKDSQHWVTVPIDEYPNHSTTFDYRRALND
jgi:hypothetical protein